jgi:hypothetical protein
MASMMPATLRCCTLHAKPKFPVRGDRLPYSSPEIQLNASEQASAILVVIVSNLSSLRSLSSLDAV